MKDKALLAFVKEVTEGILQGADTNKKCYVISEPLCNMLHFFGIGAKLQVYMVKRSNNIPTEHYVVLLPDGRILDCTANQFLDNKGKPRNQYYLGKKPSHYIELAPEQVAQLIAEKVAARNKRLNNISKSHE